jgi:hypothetical protein
MLRHVLIVSCVIASMTWSGCAGRMELRPALTATSAGIGGAVGTSSNVRLVASADSWDGELVRHFDEIAPLQVTITNGGTVPLSIRYEHFRLMTGAGETSAALPPFDIDQTQTVPFERAARAGVYPYPLRNFAVAPYLVPYYPGLPIVDGRFLYDGAFYGRYYPRWVRVQLPTAEMLRKALPEGILRPDGNMTGFLYFDRPHEATTAALVFDMVNAVDDESVGAIRIPFVAEED